MNAIENIKILYLFRNYGYVFVILYIIVKFFQIIIQKRVLESILLGNKTCFAALKENLHKTTTKSYIGLNMCKSLCHKLSEVSTVHT